MSNGSGDVSNEHHGGLKGRLVEELKAFWLIALYLWVFLGAFTVYRRLISAEVGVPYVNLGFAFVEALIIAKVILIGKMFAFTRRYEDRPLVVPVLYKSLLFGVLVMAFSVVERLVEGWMHHQGLLGGLREFSVIGMYEIGARVLMMIVAFVPFFAFGEIGRVVGAERLIRMFFSSQQAHSAPAGEASGGTSADGGKAATPR